MHLYLKKTFKIEQQINLKLIIHSLAAAFRSPFLKK